MHKLLNDKINQMNKDFVVRPHSHRSLICSQFMERKKNNKRNNWASRPMYVIRPYRHDFILLYNGQISINNRHVFISTIS